MSLIALLLPTPERSQPSRSDPERGQFFDSRGVPLTIAEARWQPAVNMEVLRRHSYASVSRFVDALAQEFDMDRERLSGFRDEYSGGTRERQIPIRITGSRMQELKDWLSASEWRDSPRLIRFIRMPGRMYPQREIAANLVGFVDRDGHGQEGMERELDEILRAGADARLSIAVDMQRLLAYRMQRVIDEHDLREANAVVIDMGSQRIASIVSLPSFNPAISRQRSGPQVRLRPVTDVFQAGPLLEPFFLSEVLSSTLEQGPLLRARFVRAEAGVGTRMVNELGYESARASLESADLLSQLDIDFPAVTIASRRVSRCVALRSRCSRQRPNQSTCSR